MEVILDIILGDKNVFQKNKLVILYLLNKKYILYLGFFVACIFESLEHLHNNNIIHRDLKPENLVLDDKGYVRLTDLGVARILKSENSCDTSGTPGYMAPEVMCRLNHGIGVDYYALGVIGFEFMFGRVI